MKYVIVIAILASFVYSVYSHVNLDVQKCVTEKMKKCMITCDPDYMFKKLKNGTIDSTRNYCCEISRCAYCINEKIGVDRCGASAKQILESTIAAKEILFENHKCTESLRYPSAKCYYHYHTNSQMDYNATTCVGKKLQNCNKTCDFTFMKFESGTLDWTNNYCCEISRCNNCLTKNFGVGTCGLTGEQFIEQDVENFETIFKANNCIESERHGSAKCNYYFYTAWFYVVPLILVFVGGIVFVIIKRRR